MWCWRKLEKISWTNHVGNEEVPQRAKQERNIPHIIKGRKANWMGHIFGTNCLLKHIIEVKKEGRMNVTGRRGRRRRNFLDDLKEKKRY
jgi:hypothetical protein